MKPPCAPRAAPVPLLVPRISRSGSPGRAASGMCGAPVSSFFSTHPRLRLRPAFVSFSRLHAAAAAGYRVKSDGGRRREDGGWAVRHVGSRERSKKRKRERMARHHGHPACRSFRARSPGTSGCSGLIFVALCLRGAFTSHLHVVFLRPPFSTTDHAAFGAQKGAGRRWECGCREYACVWIRVGMLGTVSSEREIERCVSRIHTRAESEGGKPGGARNLRLELDRKTRINGAHPYPRGFNTEEEEFTEAENEEENELREERHSHCHKR
ncbi:hypothetical protein B0H11DRAFT_2117021 [Mycena galericulata]|nr:hypothetical protein B0H11DRAFT_2117021 [Mycena galericulata]